MFHSGSLIPHNDSELISVTICMLSLNCHFCAAIFSIYNSFLVSYLSLFICVSFLFNSSIQCSLTYYNICFIRVATFALQQPQCLSALKCVNKKPPQNSVNVIRKRWRALLFRKYLLGTLEKQSQSVSSRHFVSVVRKRTRKSLFLRLERPINKDRTLNFSWLAINSIQYIFNTSSIVWIQTVIYGIFKQRLSHWCLTDVSDRLIHFQKNLLTGSWISIFIIILLTLGCYFVQSLSVCFCWKQENKNSHPCN